jgi:ribosomal 30S subunit maturation factor RimM
MATKTYIVAENWGKGFITHQDSASFAPQGFPANVWQVPSNNRQANLWIAKVLGTVKTRAEAQALVDAEITAAQAEYDALSEEEKALRNRPEDITLEE